MVSSYTRNLVRKRVEQSMTAQIQILRGTVGSFDPTTLIGGGLSNVQTVYTGKARIRTVSGSLVPIGEDLIDIRQTIISIPIDSPEPHANDVVKVLTDNDGSQSIDADLASRLFKVDAVEGGSLFGDARRMTCSQFHDSRYWSA